MNGCEVMVVSSGAESELAHLLQSRKERFHTIIPLNMEPVLVYDGFMQSPYLSFTEGPSWLNGKLYFTNTFLFSSRPGSMNPAGFNVLDRSGTVTALNYDIQTVGTFPLPNGNITATDFTNHAIIEIDSNGRVVKVLADSYEGKSLGGPNDLVVDAKGGIYFTDPWGGRLGEVPGTAVYYITPTGELLRMTDWNEYGFPNGCILSPDGSKFYLNAAPGMSKMTPQIQVYDVAEDGTLSNKCKFAEVIFGRTADGLTIDQEGNVYVATGTGGVQIFDPSGEYIGHIHFPKQAQNCVFGGDDLSKLYVTCRSQIYSVQTNTRGFLYPIK